MQSKQIKVSIVIPAYKEVKNIKQGVLNEVYEYLSNQKYSWEVLIVDDGSPDKTADLIQSFVQKHSGFKLMKEPHRGKGGTVIAGMLAAKGEIVLFTDMDQATPIDQLAKIIPKFAEGYDIVIGIRSGREGAPISRKVMAYGFMLLRTLILRLPYKDTQCGFKAFSSDASNKIFGKLHTYYENLHVQGAAVTAGFDLELLYIARKFGYRVAQVPVIWHHKDSNRVNAIRDSLQGFKDLLRIRINAILNKYQIYNEN